MSMQLEFREAALQKLWDDRHPDKSVTVEFSSGQVKVWECLHDTQVVGHCVGNLATGEIRALAGKSSCKVPQMGEVPYVLR
jgi:hypothetical protein